MQSRKTFILPYEPGYSGHRQAERHRVDVQKWLRNREHESAAHKADVPSIAAAADEVELKVPFDLAQ